MATQLTNCYYRQTDERKRARELFILYLFAQFIRPSVQLFFILAQPHQQHRLVAMKFIFC